MECGGLLPPVARASPRTPKKLHASLLCQDWNCGVSFLVAGRDSFPASDLQATHPAGVGEPIAMRPWPRWFPWITRGNCLSGSKSVHLTAVESHIETTIPEYHSIQRVFARATGTTGARELFAAQGRVSFVTFLCPLKKSKDDRGLPMINAEV
jgi:hypothetical protein